MNVTFTKSDPTMLETLDRIHWEQLQRRHEPMTVQQMDAEIAQLRGEEKEYDAR
jgi:hypothetical protein